MSDDGHRGTRGERGEFELLADLTSHLKRVRVTGAALVLVAVAGALALFDALPLAESTQASLAATFGLIATLLALAVALAIFRWTQGDNADTRRGVGQLKESVDELQAKLDVADRVTEKLYADEAAGRGDDTEFVPPARGTSIALHGRTYQVVDAQANSARWWATLLGRISAVAEAGEESRNAQELLSIPLSAFYLTATLDTEARGNRRTLIITRHDGHERIWSVFSGKGKHVIDVTSHVE